MKVLARALEGETLPCNAELDINQDGRFDIADLVALAELVHPFEAADVNRDRKTDIADVILVITFMYDPDSYPSNLPDPDVNRDGTVDIADLVTVAESVFQSQS